jgi:cytochrome c biogenesis protein CcmG, thiol:disulfide interchange protein DsbE
MAAGGQPQPDVREGGDRAPMHPSRMGLAHTVRHRLLWLVLVLAVVSVLIALFAFGLSRDPTLIRSPLLGRWGAEFALPTLDQGRIVRLSDLRGQVVVVNFWASWCKECRIEHPNLLAAWNRYRDQGMVLIGVDFNDKKSAALAFQRELGGDWPIVDDPGGRTALAYGVYGIPETFFIDRDGIVAYKHVGPVSYALLTDQIERLLSRRGNVGASP